MDRARIESVVQAIVDRLDGEWLLIGGALVALWLEPRRVTEDLDVMGIPGSQQQRFALMALAHDLGLPVEALNSAADFFVHRVPDWREQLEPFRRGARATLYRPTPTLFLLLKLGRLCEQDLADCEALLARSAEGALAIDRARVVAALDALAPAADPALAARRARLRVSVGLET